MIIINTPMELYSDNEVQSIYEEALLNEKNTCGYCYIHSPQLIFILRRIKREQYNMIFNREFKNICLKILELEKNLDSVDYTRNARKELEGEIANYKNQLVDFKNELNKTPYETPEIIHTTDVEIRLNELEKQQNIMMNYFSIQFPDLFIRDYKNHSYKTILNIFETLYGIGCIRSINIVPRKNYQLIFVSLNRFYPCFSTDQKRQEITNLMDQIEFIGKANIYDMYGNFFVSAQKYIYKK